MSAWRIVASVRGTNTCSHRRRTESAAKHRRGELARRSDEHVRARLPKLILAAEAPQRAHREQAVVVRGPHVDMPVADHGAVVSGSVERIQRRAYGHALGLDMEVQLGRGDDLEAVTQPEPREE